MNRLFLFLLGSFWLFAIPVDWGFEKELLLAKDEVASGKVLTNGEDKSFSMRWTLFKKDGLVVLLKYDGFPYQFVLYKDFQRNRYALTLDYNNQQNQIVLVFRDYDFESKKAKIWLGIRGSIDFIFDREI